MVKHSGHVLLREGVVGVAHQQAGLPHRAVPDHHTLQDPVLIAPTAAAAAVSPLSAAHVGGSWLLLLLGLRQRMERWDRPQTAAQAT